MPRKRSDEDVRKGVEEEAERSLPAPQSGETTSAQAGLMLSLQQGAGNRAVSGYVQRMRSAQADPLDKDTGLPVGLKAGVETLSGTSMNGVRVHYDSAEPARLNALAYAQGSDIHVGPGQEKHLPHEAWHVVQQARGRVESTTQMKVGVPLNDDKQLEREAEVMGERALAIEATDPAASLDRRAARGAGLVQRYAEQNNAEHLFEIGAVVDHTTQLVLRADRLNKPTAGDLSKHPLNEGKEVKPKKANAGSTWKAGTNTGQSLISAEEYVPEGKRKDVKIVKSIPDSLEIRQTAGAHHAELVTKNDMSASQIGAAISQVVLTDKYDGAVTQLATE